MTLCCRAVAAALALALATALSPRDMPSGALGAGTVGFLGVGTINSAVCRGLCTLAPELRPSEVLLSPRGAAKAAALAADFPGVCRVCETNQAVVDGSDTLFLAMLPQQAEECCRALRFKPGQRVISLLAGTNHSRVCGFVAPVPSGDVARAVPLPPVKDHRGVTVVYAPADADGGGGASAAGALAAAVFDALGTAVPCASEEEMATLQVGTTLMGTYYALLRAMTSWMVARGVGEDVAAVYVGRMMHSVAGDAAAAGAAGVGALIAEQTPGGFNEQAIRELTEAGVFDEVAHTMDSIEARWAGREHKRPRRE